MTHCFNSPCPNTTLIDGIFFHSIFQSNELGIKKNFIIETFIYFILFGFLFFILLFYLA